MYLHLTPEYRKWYENTIQQVQHVNNQLQCFQLFNELCMSRKRKISAAGNYVMSIGDDHCYNEKKYWESSVCKLRKTHGFYNAVLPALRLENLGYEKYFRMSATQLENLLQSVGPLLAKKYVIREPIGPAERLAITLRFLASGDSIHSLHYSYLMGVTIISNIISETCSAIYSVLQPEVLPKTLDQEKWLKIAADYETKWNFPNCIGSIDGKHINIQCPDNAGSMYYNYKHHHSIVLLAICDSDYIFRFVDIGAYSRRSDGGIFRDSVIGRKFEEGEMNIPAPRCISDTRHKPLPYCIVGDQAFPLKHYLLRPYPGKDKATIRKHVYYRLSRARKIIENAFGILASRWRIFRNSIIGSESNVMNYVKASICLHNWLRLDIKNNEEDLYLDQSIHREQLSRSNVTRLTPGGFADIHRMSANNSTSRAENIREEFCSYFNNEGALEWQ